jgi:3-hydroxyisobutyrate dehydrogenase-like beta-hydroxyacid dehydrogenase
MDAGHTVHRYNRTPDRVRELTQFGLELADTPPEVELKVLIFKDRRPAH